MHNSITTETALILRSADDLTPPAVPNPDAPGSPEFERTASNMARQFSESATEITRLIGALRAETARLDAAFGVGMYSRFSVDLQYHGHRYDHDEGSALVKEMERRAWDILVDHLGVKNVMSVAKRRQFDEQLEKGTLPPINEQTVIATLLGLADQARDFAREAAREVFGLLRPRGKYATNSAFRVGRRVILTYRVEQKYGGSGYRVSYSREQEITAIDGVFHLLDGKGVMRENKGPLVMAIDKSESGCGETVYFRFRCYKNQNLHLEFKREDLVKQLNGMAVGEYVLGEDER